MSGHRATRVGERIQDELARIIREQMRDPRAGFITVTGVEVSPDLKYAKVFFSVLGGDSNDSLKALISATPFLRRELAHCAGLKHTPALRFLEDSSIERAQRVEELLDEWEPAEIEDSPETEETKEAGDDS